MGVFSKATESCLQVLYKKIDEWANLKWQENPFGSSVQSTEAHYLELASIAREKEYPDIENFEEASGYAISRPWLDALALQTHVVIKTSTLCYAHGKVLYSALSQYLKPPPVDSAGERLTILETGTARGFSALCMAKALSDYRRPGVILTFDVLPHCKKMYWNCIADHQRGRLTREELIAPWRQLADTYIIFHQGHTQIELPKVNVGRVHFAFLDGAHTYKDVMFEYSQFGLRQFPGDMLVFDDNSPNQFPGVVKAVDEICHTHGYDKLALNSEGGRGYVVARKL